MFVSPINSSSLNPTIIPGKNASGARWLLDIFNTRIFRPSQAVYKNHILKILETTPPSLKYGVATSFVLIALATVAVLARRTPSAPASPAKAPEPEPPAAKRKEEGSIIPDLITPELPVVKNSHREELLAQLQELQIAAANKGSTVAMLQVARFLEENSEIDPQHSQALMWYTKAADGYIAYQSTDERNAVFAACKRLRNIYELGELGEEQNIEKAVEYYANEICVRRGEAIKRYSNASDNILSHPENAQGILQFARFYVRLGDTLYHVATNAFALATQCKIKETDFEDRPKHVAAVAAAAFWLSQYWETRDWERHEAKSFAWNYYKLAASLGNHNALQQLDEKLLHCTDNDFDFMIKIAHFYARGVHLKADPAKTHNLLKRAAEWGCGEAAYQLGNYYRENLFDRKECGILLLYWGKETEFNDLQALYWFLEAEKKGIEKAQPEIIKLLELLAAKKYVVALRELAERYTRNNRGVAQNFVQTQKLYTEAANLHDSNAALSLGALYEMGCPGIPSNTKLAWEWYNYALDYAVSPHQNYERYYAMIGVSKLAKNGEANWKYSLAERFKTGNGVEKSTHSAMDWYEQAARQGNPKAAFSLAQIYSNAIAREAPSNPPKAIEYFENAIKLGSVEASYALGKLIFEGRLDLDGQPLLNPNPKLARKSFENAAANNHQEAIQFLKANYKDT